MGWKAIKEHYRIDHDVQVVPEKGICIGSPYIHDIIVISPAGEIVKRYDPGRGWSVNDKLQRYQHDMEADPAMLKQLLDQQDTFSRAVQVFTYEGADIIECACEELGWPNVTHDGRMMYENTFTPDRDQAVRWAIRSARSSIEAWTDQVDQRARDYSEARAHLTRRQNDLRTLLEREGEPS